MMSVPAPGIVGQIDDVALGLINTIGTVKSDKACYMSNLGSTCR